MPRLTDFLRGYAPFERDRGSGARAGRRGGRYPTLRPGLRAGRSAGARALARAPGPGGGPQPGGGGRPGARPGPLLPRTSSCCLLPPRGVWYGSEARCKPRVAGAAGRGARGRPGSEPVGAAPAHARWWWSRRPPSWRGSIPPSARPRGAGRRRPARLRGPGARTWSIWATCGWTRWRTRVTSRCAAGSSTSSRPRSRTRCAWSSGATRWRACAASRSTRSAPWARWRACGCTRRPKSAGCGARAVTVPAAGGRRVRGPGRPGAGRGPGGGLPERPGGRPGRRGAEEGWYAEWPQVEEDLAPPSRSIEL